ncbi:hypothetical protein D9M69_543410 [compost metagenome]
MANPGRHLGFIDLEAAQAVEYGDVVQRVDIAADHGRHRALAGAGCQVLGQERGERVAFFEVFDDGGGLGQHLAVVEKQAGYAALGVERLVLGLVLLAAVLQQVYRDVPDVQPLQRQGDTHPVGGGGAVIGVEVHGNRSVAGVPGGASDAGIIVFVINLHFA